MSRSGYDYDLDSWALIRWRGAVSSAMKGKRGQAMLKELLVALEALPQKRLVDGDLRDAQGDVCAFGALCVSKGVDTSDIPSDDCETLAKLFNVAPAMAREIVYKNDDDGFWTDRTPEQRYEDFHAWLKGQIKE